MVIIKAIQGIIKGKLGIKVPLKVQHYCSYRCNFRCKYCNLYSQKSKELSTKEIKAILEDFAKAGTVSWTFTGGEPLLRKDMKELVEYAKKLNMHVAMTTNGSLVKQNIDWLNKIDLLNISLDGPKEFHNEMRRGGSYDITIEAIKLLKQKNINVAITSVINKKSMENNWEYLRKTLALSKELGSKIVIMPVYCDQFNKEKINDLMLSQEELKEGIKILREFKKENPHQLIMSNSALDWYEGKTKKMKCFAGKYFCSIFPDGSVWPCLFKKEEKKGTLTPIESFKKLKIPKNCSCNLNCYVEYNHLLSLNPKSLYEFIFQYHWGV